MDQIFDISEELKKAKEAAANRVKRRRIEFKRRGKKSFYHHAIEEEDDRDSNPADNDAKEIRTAMDYEKNHDKDLVTVAMEMNKNTSLTSLYDLNMLRISNS